jgi:glutathione S-transferase
VRRVGMTLHHYGLRFERNRTSVFDPAMVDINPLMRIPSLIIDGDEILHDSTAILDYLDEIVGPQRALTPPSGARRRGVLRATVLAAGTAEKAGAVVYERHFHPKHAIAHEWTARCLSQIAGALVHLDAHCKEPWYFGAGMTQTDITIACMIGYFDLRLPECFPPTQYPALERLYARCEALDAFKTTQPSSDEVMPR